MATYSMGKKSITDIIIYGACFLILFIFICFIASKASDIFLLKKIYRKYYDANQLYKETQNFKITEEKIVIESESESVTLIKNKINRIRFDKDSIYIFTGLNSSYIIKERFFNNSAEFEKVKAFINDNYTK